MPQRSTAQHRQLGIKGESEGDGHTSLHNTITESHSLSKCDGLRGRQCTTPPCSTGTHSCQGTAAALSAVMFPLHRLSQPVMIPTVLCRRHFTPSTTLNQSSSHTGMRPLLQAGLEPDSFSAIESQQGVVAPHTVTPTCQRQPPKACGKTHLVIHTHQVNTLSGPQTTTHMRARIGAQAPAASPACCLGPTTLPTAHTAHNTHTLSERDAHMQRTQQRMQCLSQQATTRHWAPACLTACQHTLPYCYYSYCSCCQKGCSPVLVT